MTEAPQVRSRRREAEPALAPELGERLRRRDPTALQEAYAEYGAATFGLLLRLLRDRGAAEDVQQQVFLEVWQRGANYDAARGSVLAWIMTIARSRALDYMRQRVPEPHDPAVAAELADDAGGGAAEVDRLVDQWRVAHLLSRLPAEEELLLRRRFYGELSQSEIAAETGIPLGTVKMRMVQGLERLRGLLDAEGVAL